MKIMVLGGGLVGSAIAIDLANEKTFDVTVVDISSTALDRLIKFPGINGLRADLTDTQMLKEIIGDTDLVVGAVPGFMGFQTLKAVIEAGKNIVDISFFDEDPFLLDDLAKEKGVIAIVDCGVAPGCSNVFMGYVDSILDETERFFCCVGGLPKVRRKPYEYKAVFSPIDVIEEYTRPARYIENGRSVTRPALSEPELLDFDGIGTLEAFNTDGLRTLMKTMKARFMKEKTLRYPGHIEIMKLLRDTGFFDKQPVEVDELRIRPIDLTAKLLFPKWKLDQGEEDFTIMRIVIEGIKAGQRLRYSYNLLDHYDKNTHTTSMARTTGYTCSVTTRLVANGDYNRVGISPPEFIGQQHAVFKLLMEGLRQRNIEYREKVEKM